MNLLILCEKFLLSQNFIFHIILEMIWIGISLIFFKKIFKASFSKKNQIIFLLVNTICFTLSNLFLQYVCSYLLTFITSIVFLIYLLKESPAKVITYFSLESIILVNIHFLILNILHRFLPNSYSEIATFPIFNLLTLLLLSVVGTVIYLCSKRFKVDTFLEKVLVKKSPLIIGISVFNLLTSFAIFYYGMEALINNAIYLVALDLYYYISISTIIATCHSLYFKEKINYLELRNKTTLSLSDSTRAFKHDFHNILQAIGGYILTDDMDGLKKYYADVSKDCKCFNNLCKLTPETINNPAIYNILVNKYNAASNQNIDVNLDIMLDLNRLNIRIYELSRILGILLDNAIEACKECNKKNINVSFKEENQKQVLIVENTFKDNKISIDQLFEKDFTTKPNNSGLGLWEIRQILKKHSNLNLHTSKNNDYFLQQLEIYSA